MQILLKDPRTEKLFDICDRGNNFPLHVAAKKGYLSIVTDLIEVIDVSINAFDSYLYVQRLHHTWFYKDV